MKSGIGSNSRGEENSVDGIVIRDKAETAPDADEGKQTPSAQAAGRTGEGEGGERPPRGELESVRARLTEQEKLAAEYLDLLKRKQADFENYRKRSQKEIDEFKKYATTELVVDILDLLDNFERAVESARSAKDFDALLEGILIIRQQFRNLLEKKYGVKNIVAVGKEFDPNLHDAVMVEESGEFDRDTVIEDLRKGYVMHDRIIRPSKVKVAKAAAQSGGGGDVEERNERG
jgi:molecular chaperone GrpE